MIEPEAEVLECPNCGRPFSKRSEIDIEDEQCPYCGFNYKNNRENNDDG